MKKILLSLILLGSTAVLFSQTATLTSNLSQKLTNGNNSDYFKVNIVLSSQVNHIVLNEEMKQNKTSVSERAKRVMRESMTLATQSQTPIINLLNKNSNKVSSFKSFWIINMMTIEATKDIILQLANMPEVDYIEEFDHYTGKPIEVIKSTTTTQKSVGGIEPGLAAIKAPALWAMGYTGKARKYYSIDTGVWKDHPAISGAWLGNYQPLTQAWHAIDSPIPIDKGNAHGTHTAGTVLGLEKATNDTIGVAFNAYFMASDPIVTNLANIKPLPEYIDVFEFALNPDGDTNTTDDIPDAINNSWGISGQSGDTSICSSYVTQMFDAIEAAGIANVFSAGNSGPNDTTIGKPQYVSTGLVNTFTVGAVDGANATFPIAGFSSHGPTACPVTGPLQIKPEVVAPGINVRSAVANNNYASYNGTSMAGPHATGAVLLLKEAFPNATGEEILLALYNSAIDLGVAGEDNTYGRGMIDVLAAFNLLSLTYTPTPPNQFKYDILISEITNPSDEIVCDQNVTATVLIENKGDSAISNANIIYQLNNETAANLNWVGILLPGDTTSVYLPTITANGFGNYELKVKIEIDTLKKECDYINNQRVARFNIRELYSILPYKEDFEMMRIDSSEWIINNPDGELTWDTASTSGLPYGYYSASMDFGNYTKSGETDDLISTRISLPNDDSLYLRFDVAYQMKHVVLADSLFVYISTDCANTFTEIYKKGGTSLETHDTLMSPFYATQPHHWRTDYVDITTYAGNDIILKFKSFNRRGNNLYLDNIWVYEGVEPLSVVENKINPLSIYPNPTQNNITIDLGNNDIKNSTLILVDLLGKYVSKTNVSQRLNKIDMSNLSNGIYFIKFSNKNGSVTEKIIKR